MDKGYEGTQKMNLSPSTFPVQHATYDAGDDARAEGQEGRGCPSVPGSEPSEAYLFSGRLQGNHYN